MNTFKKILSHPGMQTFLFLYGIFLVVLLTAPWLLVYMEWVYKK